MGQLLFYSPSTSSGLTSRPFASKMCAIVSNKKPCSPVASHFFLANQLTDHSILQPTFFKWILIMFGSFIQIVLVRRDKSIHILPCQFTHKITLFRKSRAPFSNDHTVNCSKMRHFWTTPNQYFNDSIIKNIITKSCYHL